MSSFEEKLQEWIVHETNGLCEASMISIPSVSALGQLTVGKNKKIWQYLVEHVKSKQTVRHIRNVLRVKKAQCELNNLYPVINKNNCETLKQEISKTEEKAKFVESSLSNMRKNICILKQAIESLRERNHIISQKCTFLELEISNYKGKNESLTAVLEEFLSLVNIIFSSERISCLQNLIVQKSLDITNTNLQPPNDTIRYLLIQISSILENEFLSKGDKLSFFELSKSFKKIGNSTNALNFLNVMKQHLKQSEDLLNENNFLATGFAYQPKQNIPRMSSEHLQSLKLDQVNSSLLRIKMMNYLNKIAQLEKVISNENKIIVDIKSQTLREFVLVSVENACLEENIKYLESVLMEELQKTKNILEKNNEQKSKCVRLRSVVQNFYQILEFIQVLLETTPKTFLNSESKLILSNDFLRLNLFSHLKDELNVCDVKSYLQLNYIGSLDILQSKHFLKCPLNYFDLDTVEVPKDFWDSIGIKPFQNLHLLCENLSHIKRELSFGGTILKCDSDEVIEPFDYMTECLKNKLEHLKIAITAATETNLNCQGLKNVFDEWFHQKAQFISEIVYDGKSLKMWIDILNALGDF